MAGNQVRRSDTEWENIIRQCKTSGKSDYQWCVEHGIASSTFYRKLRQFRNIQPVEDTLTQTRPVLAEQHAVVPLTLLEGGHDMDISGFKNVPAATIRFQGISVDLYPEAGADIIGNILQMAVQLC